tara:strand:- start:210 stop:476 length:267 start_codon:yes stop_codon:yes gene_type:complete
MVGYVLELIGEADVIDNDNPFRGCGQHVTLFVPRVDPMEWVVFPHCLAQVLQQFPAAEVLLAVPTKLDSEMFQGSGHREDGGGVVEKR